MKNIILFLFLFFTFSCQKKQYASFQSSRYEDFRTEKIAIPKAELTELPIAIDVDQKLDSSNVSVLNSNDNSISKSIENQKPIFRKKLRNIKLLIPRNISAKDTSKKSLAASIDAQHQKTSKLAGNFGYISIVSTIIGILLFFTPTIGAAIILILLGGISALIGLVLGIMAGRDSNKKISKLAKAGIAAGILYPILLILGAVLFFAIANYGYGRGN